MLLEEALARRTVRASQEGKWPSGNVRRHPLPGCTVIVGEVLLGDADIGPIDAVGMREPHFAFVGTYCFGFRGGGFGRTRFERRFPASRRRAFCSAPCPPG